ncbi:unnamed protein product [Agarophyton chilense]
MEPATQPVSTPPYKKQSVLSPQNESPSTPQHRTPPPQRISPLPHLNVVSNNSQQPHSSVPLTNSANLQQHQHASLQNSALNHYLQVLRESTPGKQPSQTLQPPPPSKIAVLRLPPEFRLSEADLLIASEISDQTQSLSTLEPAMHGEFMSAAESNAFAPSAQTPNRASPNLLDYHAPHAHASSYMRNAHVSTPGSLRDLINLSGADDLPHPTDMPLPFASADTAFTHWSTAPRAANKWTCNTCLFQFAYKDHLARHRAFVHEGKAESKCSHCSKVYVEFKSLRRHINVS